MESTGYFPWLRSIAQSMCVPFWWHGLDREGEYRIHYNGTVCFVQTPMRLIAVTARHVFDEYRKAKSVQPDLRCQFGGTTTAPEDRLIAEDEYLDIATFTCQP